MRRKYAIDYAWTLDTDGYFPAPIAMKDNPLVKMYRDKKYYGFSHISRDQAAQVQHLWEFTRIYMEQRRIDAKSTKLMRRMTDALVLRDTYWHEWNRLLFMNDIEIVQLNWFCGRGGQSKDVMEA